MLRVCVFCGSSVGTRPAYLAAARRLGQLLAERSIGLVYGGANVGMMGALADACRERGGYVIGIIPQALVAKEVAHRGLSDLRIVGSMHERKAMMAELSDAFLALPGGFGTFEELFEVVTWSQLGLLNKPTILIDTEGYYKPLMGFIDHASREGFIQPTHKSLILCEDSPGKALDRLAAWRPVARSPKLISRSET